MPAARRPTNDQGDTLIELIIAVVIMGIAVAAIIGGLGTSIFMSDVHRKQATAGAYVRNYAEAIETAVAGGGYVPCATTSSYATPAGFSVPSNYSSSVVAGSMRYWNGSAWQTTCAVSTDTGLEQMTLRVASSDSRASEQLVLVVRKRCGSGSPC